MAERSVNRGNRRLALALVSVAAVMIGAAYASVPLYRLFCQVTGYGGTTQVAEAAPAEAGERVFHIRFNADVDPALPWAFQPVEREMTVKVGESALALFRAENRSDHATAGRSEEHTSELQSLMRISFAVLCLKKQKNTPS